MQRALIEIFIVALACGPLGVWVLLYRQSYAAESISHAMLPGLVVAALIGFPFLFGALLGVLVSAVAIAVIASRERLGADVGVAVAISALIGLGAILALSPSVPININALLFGNLLGVDGRDLLAGGVLAVVLLVGLLGFQRPLTIGAFDRTSARSLGIRYRRVELALLVALGVATAVVAQALGALLLFALIIAPAATALSLTDRLPLALLFAPIAVTVAGTTGLLASYRLDIAAGASVATCAVLLFLVVQLFGVRRAKLVTE